MAEIAPCAKSRQANAQGTYLSKASVEDTTGAFVYKFTLGF